MGMTHLNNMIRFQQEDKVRIAALCDVDDNSLEAALQNASAAAPGGVQGRAVSRLPLQQPGLIKCTQGGHKSNAVKARAV